MKVCNKCKVQRPLTEYYFDKRYNVYFGKCKDCHNKQAKDYRDSKEGKTVYHTWVQSDKGKSVRTSAINK